MSHGNAIEITDKNPANKVCKIYGKILGLLLLLCWDEKSFRPWSTMDLFIVSGTWTQKTPKVETSRM